ncbi:MAG: flavin reductase family protein [Chloroflexi bacterium]|nr:flavin reductase family protein [Chloroflexota bacterium]
MPKQRQGLRPGLFPTPAVMVSCQDEEGKPNIVTLAWAGVACSEPPMLGIAIRPSRLSHGIISRSGEFVVNIPGVDQLRATDICGTVSGRNVDKFAAAQLTPAAASRVKAPLIEECPVNLECVVRHKLALGSHDLFIGEVVAVHASSEYLDDKGAWDISKMKPFAYCASTYWSLGQQIGVHSFTVKK